MVSSPQGVVAASEDGAVRCFHPDTFAQSWDTSVSGPPRSASISQGMVIIGCEDRSIHVLSLADGRKAWSSNLQESVRLAPAVSGKTLWVATERREIWRFDLLTGGNRKRVQIQDLPSSSLSIHGAWFLAGMRSGTVFAFGLDEATPAFRMAATKSVSSAPVALPDGTVVVASEDRKVRGYKRIGEPAPRPQK
jgi:outer membrane protein assembly factor BamB